MYVCMGVRNVADVPDGKSNGDAGSKTTDDVCPHGMSSKGCVPMNTCFADAENRDRDTDREWEEKELRKKDRDR